MQPVAASSVIDEKLQKFLDKLERPEEETYMMAGNYMNGVLTSVNIIINR